MTAVGAAPAVFDEAFLTKVMGKEMPKDEVKEFLDLYLEECSTNNFPALTKTIGSESWDAASKAAHSLKGSARQVGCFYMGEIAAGLEQACKKLSEIPEGNAELVAEVKSLWGQLQDGLQDVEKALAKFLGSG